MSVMNDSVSEAEQRERSESFSRSEDSSEQMLPNAGSSNFSESSERFLDEDVGSEIEEASDPILEKIKKNMDDSETGKWDQTSLGSVSSGGSSGVASKTIKISEHYINIPYGIQLKDTYEHGKTNTDIMGVTYNGRMRQFVLLDSKGIVSWKRDAVDHRVARSLSYPRYQYRLITYLLYVRKYNCYFALEKDLSLKVLNRDFAETANISSELNSILFMLFNPIRDELITGGVNGVKVYLFHQATSKVITEVKPLANYQLTLRYELPNVGGSWVKKVELDYNLEHLYCCSDTDLHVYNLEGKQLFKFNRAHNMSITGCRYSVAAKLLVTSSLDAEVKVWSMTGGLVHTFRGHSRAVTNLLIHPNDSTIVITCSLDGSLRMWSLDTMEAVYSLVLSSCGLLWMGLTDDNLLYISTARSVSLWNLNHFVHFWSLTRSKVTQLQLEGSPGKTQRVLAVGEDSSIRLFSRSNQKNLSTVLPPPNISPLQRLLGVCYSREFNVMFVLISEKVIWVYTTRTDPACRMAVWDIFELQTMAQKSNSASQERTLLPSTKIGPSHRATESGVGNELPCCCLCMCILKSSAMLWTDEGCCCPVRHSYLLLGLEDGRILFMDPVVKGQKFMEFNVSKDPVVDMHHDVDHHCLVTVCRAAELTYIQYWSLPDLELQHEVFCSSDLTAHARIGYSCMTGHESGSVFFHILELANDPGLYRGRVMPELKDVVDINHRPEHWASVITVDACVAMKIFCSCSKDGAIKIWEEGGFLLTEIMLDDTLSAACFFNKSADLIVAFQNQIFFISHSKVCPHLEPMEPEDFSFDKESYIHEDPAVMYEGIVADPDPLDLDTYLVPFDIEFSKDFLEGRITLEPEKEAPEESDEDEKLSLAPTEIYLSSPSTPDNLSMIDLTLGSEVTKFDLLQQMKSTLELLIAKEKRTQVERKDALDDKLDSTQEADKQTKEAAGDDGKAKRHVVDQKYILQFQFPRFEGSPGPTPSITPSSTPQPDLPEEEESDIEQEVQKLLPPKKIPDMQLVAEAVMQQERVRKKKEREAAGTQAKIFREIAQEKTKDLSKAQDQPKQPRRAITDVKVDVTALMRGRRQVDVVKKEADHSHVARPSSSETGEKRKSQRTPVMKKSAPVRRLTKKGTKERIDDKDQLIHGKKPDDSGQQEDDQSTVQTQIEICDIAAWKISEKDTIAGAAELVSIGTKVMETATAAEATSRLEEWPRIQAMLPPFSALPDPEERSPSPVSLCSARSADSRKQFMETFRDELSNDWGASPTGDCSSTAASVLDTPASTRSHTPSAFIRSHTLSALTKSGSLSALSEAAEGRNNRGRYLVKVEDRSRSSSIATTEEGSRIRSQMSSVSSREEGGQSQAEKAASVPVQSPYQMDVKRCWSQASEDPIFEGLDQEWVQDHTETLITRNLPPSPWQHFSLTQISKNRQLSGSASHKDTTGKESIGSGADYPFSIADSSSERAGSPESVIPDGELVFFKESPGAADEDQHRAWSRVGLLDTTLMIDPDRPATTFVSAQNGHLEGMLRQRPYTAASFQTELRLMLELPGKAEELRALFEATYRHYQRVHGRVTEDCKKLYSNKGTSFEEKWHERILERHMLLRMQRALRAHAAQQRRQMLLMQQRAKSAPSRVLNSLSPQGQVMDKPPRSNTAHASLLPATTPAPSPARGQSCLTVGEVRVSAVNQPVKNEMREKHQQLLIHRKKQQLGEEQPFRFRVKDLTQENSRIQRKHKIHVNPWLIDPRNPTAVRPKSSKSIPSKCSRYILLSHPSTVANTPMPTPLEEELLVARFPEQSKRLLHSAGTIMRPTPSNISYGITYSPFILYG